VILPVRRLVFMLAGVALLAPASTVVTSGNVVAAAAPAVTELGGVPIGCVGAAASFTGQAYCLDGNHTADLATVHGATQTSPDFLTDQIQGFGVLELNGWQVPTRCDGNGTAGKREQLVYVHVKGEPDIYTKMQAFIQQRLIPGANGVFEHTTAGKRAIRWVTQKTATGCAPTILKVTVPKSANVSGFPFQNIGQAVLSAVGGARANRSYLVLVDHADAYYDCGLGQVRQDGRPGAVNLNNSGGAFAMVWANCWTGLIAAHELTHTMGAVQPGSPHHTDNGHCWDGRDAMCYADGSPQKQQLICKKPDDYRKLDCNGDDYFALYPKPGSYLAKHWNSATSPFLIDSLAVALPTQPGKPTGLAVTSVDASHVRLTWQAGVTKHGALTHWTVLVGASDGGTEYSDVGKFPVTASVSRITLNGKARSALVAVKPYQIQGFAVMASNASGDGITSAIVQGGAGAAPSAIVATYIPADPDNYTQATVSWTGGTSPVGVTTCTAVLVNGARVDGATGTVEQTTDPNGVCYSDDPTGTYLPTPLLPTDVLQIYSRNAFGVTEITVPLA
jgi:hypothetical protein